MAVWSGSSAAPPSGRSSPAACVIESLVEQIEARFAEVQAEMADPEVISDRLRYAEAGRRFNQLGVAAKLESGFVS